MTKEYEKFVEFNNANVEAFMTAGKVAATGAEELARKWTSFVKTTVEDTVEASSALFACKDIQQVYDLQAKQARKFWDQWLTESTKLSELSYKVASDSFAPLSERATTNMSEAAKTVS